MKNALLLLPIPLIVGWVAYAGWSYEGETINLALLSGAGPAVAAPKLEGWEKRGQPKAYNKDNLYEYVNGHAEFFISAGFDSLTVFEYTAADGGGELTLEVYDLKTPDNARGVLAQEKGTAEPVDDIGQAAYAAQGLLLFQKGKYYLKASGFDLKPDALTTAARNAAATFDVKTATKDKSLLPTANMLAGSESFIKSDYLALSFLKNVKTAAYRYGDAEAEGFAFNATPEQLVAFYKEEGSEVEKMAVAGLNAWLINDKYEGRISVVSDGKTTIGLKGDPGMDNIQTYLGQAAERLKEQ